MMKRIGLERLERLERNLRSVFPGNLLENMGDALVMRVASQDLIETMMRLRDGASFDFKLLIDLTGVHYPDRDPEFDVVYQLLSVYKNLRLRLKVSTDGRSMVPSVTSVWSSADWYEREAYDMFGILFSGHPDLRRILNEYDFEGHPLRKDFPLSGRYDLRYDETQKRVVRVPVDLPRENREYSMKAVKTEVDAQGRRADV